MARRKDRKRKGKKQFAYGILLRKFTKAQSFGFAKVFYDEVVL